MRGTVCRVASYSMKEWAGLAELESKQRASDAARYAAEGAIPERFGHPRPADTYGPAARQSEWAPTSAVARFRASMEIDYEKWPSSTRPRLCGHCCAA